MAATAAENAVLVLAVRINGVEVDTGAVVLRDWQGQFLVSAESVALWRLRAAGARPVAIEGSAYFRLGELGLAATRFDAGTGTLELTADPTAFLASTLSLEAAPGDAATPPGFGAFLNYDLNATSSARGLHAAGLIELGLFGPRGVLTHNVLTGNNGVRNATTRLDTTFSSDFPRRLETLRLGDVTTVSGAWGTAFRMGGIQFGTNFDTRPGFVTVPLQTASGLAALPSVVDVYVNSVLAAQRAVPAGPFALNNLPVVSGSGQITMVVRDALGREQVITQSFASSVQLLREGLSNYSAELGVLRRNYTLLSNDYGPLAGSATYRHGLTNELTAEAHAEARVGVANAGVSAAVLLGQLGTMLGTLAGSRAGAKTAGLLGWGYERSDSQTQWMAHVERRATGFTDVAAEASTSLARPRLSFDASASRNFGAAGTLGGAYIGRRLTDGTRFAVANATYSVSLFDSAFLSITFQRTLSSPMASQLSAFISFPLGANATGAVSQQSSRTSTGTRDETTLQAQRNAPAGVGLGYLVQASSLGNARAQAVYQAERGIFLAEAEQVDGAQNVRVAAQGGVGMVGASLLLARPLLESFALVRAPAAPNTRVYANNQLIGRTDGQGELTIPRIRAYEQNQVSLEQLDLGLDTEFTTLTVTVVPYRRTGLVVEFPIRRTRAAIVHVELENGEALPTFVRLTEEASSTPIPVGNAGVVYLSGMALQTRFTARWLGRECSFVILYPAVAEPVPDLGRFRCVAVEHQ